MALEHIFTNAFLILEASNNLGDYPPIANECSDNPDSTFLCPIYFSPDPNSAATVHNALLYHKQAGLIVTSSFQSVSITYQYKVEGSSEHLLSSHGLGIRRQECHYLLNKGDQNALSKLQEACKNEVFISTRERQSSQDTNELTDLELWVTNSLYGSNVLPDVLTQPYGTNMADKGNPYPPVR